MLAHEYLFWFGLHLETLRLGLDFSLQLPQEMLMVAWRSEAGKEREPTQGALASKLLQWAAPP